MTLQESFSTSWFYGYVSTWRKRVSSGLSDVYDGRIWKEFQVIHGRPFLFKEHNLTYMLNIDWFQPYKQSVLSNNNQLTSISSFQEGKCDPDCHYCWATWTSWSLSWTLGWWTCQFVDGHDVPSQWWIQMKNETVRGALLSVACDLHAGRRFVVFLVTQPVLDALDV